ncbi:MAG: hypothetical protein AAB495_04505 [Patescibacteria group bacterium]
MIGLSISFCIRDIASGKVDAAEVEKIIGGTAAQPHEVDDLISIYKKVYWSAFPKKAEAIFREMLAAGKISQPRLLDGRCPLPIASGPWVKSESDITWRSVGQED